MAGERVLVCEVDEILTAGSELSEEFSELATEDDYVGPLPAGLIERPDERTMLTYKSRPFTVATSINDCHGVLRSVYAVHGRKGLDTFFGENGFVPRRIGTAEHVDYVEPEQFLGRGVHLYRLFREANRYLRDRAQEILPKIEAAALKTAQQRLDESRVAVEAETVRYFRSVDNEDDAAHVLAASFRSSGSVVSPSGRARAGSFSNYVACRKPCVRSKNASPG
jgi:hypothetical protein